VQPAVDVGVPQVGPVVAELAQVGQADAELGAESLVGDFGGAVGSGGGGDAVGGELLDGAADDQVALVGVDGGGGGDDVQAPGPLLPQHRDHVGERGVASGQGGIGGGHDGSLLAR
jgi:hypothetical protein